jgi:hypothetical protein
MRKANCWLTVGLIAGTIGQASAIPGDYLGRIAPPKTEKRNVPSSQPTRPPGPGIQVGGEDFANAVVIPGLPYADGGSTCGYRDDYYPTCAFGGNSTASDVVYVYTPTADGCINVDVCDSGYDTIVHVYAGNAGNMVACNDDACGPFFGLNSLVEGVSVTAGVPYYIVIDGYAENCGDYNVLVTECPPPCDPACPPGSVQEGEVVCSDGYDDQYNGGCNSTPPVFTNVECNDTGVTVCGTYGTFVGPGGLDTRDTDWYQVELTTPTTLNVCVCGSQPTQLAIVNADCSFITLACGSVFGAPNEQICCQVDLGPGTYWIFVSTDGFFGFDCGSGYKVNISGYTCPPVGVEPASWSTMKSIYR